MSEPDSSRRQRYWLWQTKRLFPHPIFAGCISLACLVVGVLFAGVAISVPGCWPMGIPSALFFAGAIATASAALTRSNVESLIVSGDVQSNKPTFAIVVLLIGVYSWWLTLALHVFDAFFKNGPGSVKYFVTLGIAISSTLFMQIKGKRIVRQHFGARGVRNLELSGRQASYVVLVVLSFSLYLMWLMS